MATTLDTALALHQAGISVLPVCADGTKRPAGAWKHLQTAQPTVQEIRGWFTGTDYGLGVITGAVSGNLELLELEGRAATRLPELRDLAQDTGLGDVYDRLTRGWFEMSPSGGYHFFYRTTEPVPGNTKLAQAQNRECLAETRGEGGYSVVAPTAGKVHATGNPWVVLMGGPGTIPVLTTDEREAMHALFGTLDERVPDPEPTELDLAFHAATTPGAGVDGSVSPGDDYDAKTDWADLLIPAGWTLVTRQGNTRYWRRPGKKEGLWSASTGRAQDRDRLYVFTTSTDFQAETPYTKFGAYALLHHNGDHSAAAKQLRADGYGTPITAERTLTLITNNNEQDTPPWQSPSPTSPHAPAATAPGSASTSAPTNPPTLPPTASHAAGTDTTGTGSPNPAHPDSTPSNPTPHDGNLATVTQLRPKPAPVTLTDTGNTELLIHRHGTRLRYAPSRGKWLCWDGGRWEWQEDDGPAIGAAIETVQAITPNDDAERNHKHRSLSRGALEAMTALARRDYRVRVNSDQLDAHPYLLNTPTGTVDLRTGAAHPCNPAELHTKTTGAAHETGAQAEKWQAFLVDTFAGDADLIRFTQHLAGYAAIGEVTHHVLPFLFGSGGNGKSVFLDVLMRVLGDYATSAPAGFLMAGRDQHETEVARLAGVRLVVCSEVNQDAKFDEEKVKLLTGGDELTARFMRQDHFTFAPSHTLFLMGNHQPRVGAGGESFWRRLRMLPFTVTVPPEKRVEGLARALIEQEGPGILNWVVDGAREVIRDGLNAPAAVLAATSEYAQEEDALARFAADHVSVGGGDAARVNTAHMRTAYTSWCRAQGEKELSPQMFGREMRTRFGVDQARSNGRRYYTNVTLLDLDDLDEEQKFEHWLDK